jgi:hypothetical protein
MQPQSDIDTAPRMAVIDNRPAKVTHLRNIDGTYVQCKLPNGDEAYVPLREISDLIQEDLLSRFPRQKDKQGPIPV